jgi:hypothetical protein
MCLIASRPLTAVDLIAIEVEGGGHTHTHTASSEINTATTLPCQRQVPTPQHRALPPNATPPLPARETGRARAQRVGLSQNLKDTKDTGRVPDLPFRNSQKSVP